MSSPNTTIRLLHLALVPAALLVAASVQAQEPLLSYNFNESSTTYASDGSARAELKGKGRDQGAGQPGSGVSGQKGDRAWDASSAKYQALDSETKQLNRSMLAHDRDENAVDNLHAMTLVFWFNADQALSPAANRFVFNASSSGKPTHGFYVRAVSRASGGGRAYALEFAPGRNGAEAKAIVSQYSPPGTGYSKVGEWVFVAITWNGGRVDFYVGDRSSPARPAGSGAFSGSLGDEKQRFVIGNTGAANRGFDGKIDNFRLYDVALSPAAIEALRAADAAGQPAS